MNRIAILLAGALMLAGVMVAQESAQPREKVRVFTMDEPFTVVQPGMNMMTLQGDRWPAQIEFFSAEVAAAGEVVTGAPYTATAVTESTQTLGDGNRIVNKNSAFLARDGQGRTRRESTIHRIGPMQVADTPKVFFINDPVTHTQYVVTEGEATKIVRKEGEWSVGPKIIAEQRAKEEVARTKELRQKIVVSQKGYADKTWDEARQVKHEDLGTQTIEGVSAEGRRETVTIPAGRIGNERPIEIVSEVWTSPELHTVVLRKHSDPRFGETTYRLTEIKRGEPDASLFQPPPGAKVKNDSVIELRREPGPPKD